MCTIKESLLLQVDLHGLHVEEALQVLEQHLLSLGGLGCPGGILLQVGPLSITSCGRRRSTTMCCSNKCRLKFSALQLRISSWYVSSQGCLIGQASALLSDFVAFNA